MDGALPGGAAIGRPSPRWSSPVVSESDHEPSPSGMVDDTSAGAGHRARTSARPG